MAKRQQEIPGAERQTIKEIDDAAEMYVEARDKRMKLTKSGKVKRSHAFTSHIMVRRTTKRKRQLRKDTLCAGKFEVNMRECLGGKRR